MDLASVLLICLASLFYSTALALYVYQLRMRTDDYNRYQLWLTLAGLVCQTALIGLTATHHQGTQLAGANILMLASWSVMVAYFIFERLTKRYSYGLFIIPAVLVAMVLAWNLGSGIAPEENNPVYHDWPLLVVHIVAYFIAAAFFLLGGVSANMMLYQERELKRKNMDVVENRLPGLDFLKRVMRRSVVIGLPIFILGIMLGVIKAMGMAEPGELWWLSLRIIMSVLVFIIYIVILVQTYVIKTSANLTAKTHLVAVCGVIILTIMSAVLPMLGTVMLGG